MRPVPRAKKHAVATLNSTTVMKGVTIFVTVSITDTVPGVVKFVMYAFCARVWGLPKKQQTKTAIASSRQNTRFHSILP